MSDRIPFQRVVLRPSEGRPLDDVDYPGFLHCAIAADGVRLEIIGTSHRLDDADLAPAWEIEGDRPYVEISLSASMADQLGRVLLLETGRLTGDSTPTLPHEPHRRGEVDEKEDR